MDSKGDVMNFAMIKDILEKKNKVEFRLYSLYYCIEKKDDKYIIYSENSSEFKKEYKTLDLLFNNYTIYNENLKSNEKQIKNIK